MPTYEYLCGSCEHNFEQVQKITEDALKKCPKCGKDELKRLVNAAAFHLKGSGWYKTDYASGSSGASSSSKSSSSVSSTSSSSTTDSSKISSDTNSTNSKPSGSCGSGSCEKC